MNRLSVAVLLSGGEAFSPYRGGAIARWTYETYSLLTDRLNVTVFGAPTAQRDLYPLPHQSSPLSGVCNVLGKVPYVRRYEEKLWLRSLLRRLLRFEVLHVHNRPQWARMLRQMGYRGALVIHLHNDHLGHWAASALDGLAADADAVVTCSRYLQSTFAPRSDLLGAKSHVIFNAANRSLFFPREEIREAKTIFFVGRLNTEKGVLQLLQSLEFVLERHRDAKLVIGGGSGFGEDRETPYLREVRELAASLEKNKRARIHFTGYLDHDRDLPAWFQRATVFVCPSIFQEPFGLVNAEAMACATPVVGSNRGGIPEVIGDTGRLVNPENPREMGAAIADLLAQPALCRQLGQAAYQRCAQRFDWQGIAEAWMRLLVAVDMQRGPVC